MSESDTDRVAYLYIRIRITLLARGNVGKVEARDGPPHSWVNGTKDDSSSTRLSKDLVSPLTAIIEHRPANEWIRDIVVLTLTDPPPLTFAKFMATWNTTGASTRSHYKLVGFTPPHLAGWTEHDRKRLSALLGSRKPVDSDDIEHLLRIVAAPPSMEHLRMLLSSGDPKLLLLAARWVVPHLVQARAGASPPPRNDATLR